MADLAALVAVQVEPEEEPVRQDEVVDRHRRAPLEEDGLGEVGLADLVVAEPRAAHGEAQLVERQVLSDPDGERQRHHLEVERAVVARRDLVEAVAVIGDHAGEDVDAAGRALRVGLAAQPGREIESLLELNQVGAPRLEHGPVAAQVDLVEDVVLQLALHRVGPRAGSCNGCAGPARPGAGRGWPAGRWRRGS